MHRSARLFPIALLVPMLLILAACATQLPEKGSAPIATITPGPTSSDHQDGISQQNPNAAQSNPDLCAWLLGSLQQDGISSELGNASWDGNIAIDSTQGKNVCVIQPVIDNIGEPAYHAGEVTLHINAKVQPAPGGTELTTVDVGGGHNASVWFTGVFGDTGHLTATVDGAKLWLSMHLDPNTHTIESIQFTTTKQFLTDVMGDLLYRWDHGHKPAY